MRKVTKQDFDFSHAAEYKKIDLLLKNYVVVATEEKIVLTMHSSGVETENTARVGDYIIKTSEKDDGYVVTRDRFFEIYEEDNTEKNYYRTKITRIGLITLEDVIFVSAWNEDQVVKAGGMIIEAGSSIYGIDPFSFIRKYGRVDQTAEKNCFIRVSDSLEEQLKKAESLDLQNHVLDIKTRLQNRHLFEKLV